MNNTKPIPKILATQPLSLLKRPGELAQARQRELPSWEDIKNFISARNGEHKGSGRYVTSFDSVSLHPTVSSFSDLGYRANCSLDLQLGELGITLYSPRLLDTRRQNYYIFPVELNSQGSDYVVVNTPTITLIQSIKSTPSYNDTPFEVVCGLFNSLGLSSSSSLNFK